MQIAGETHRGDSKSRAWLAYLIVACLYTGIAVLFTYPQIKNLTSSFAENPIGRSSDQNIVMWDAWWAKKSLIDLKTNPFYTKYLFYPKGASLALHELTLLNSIITIPFQMALEKPKGLILGCNIAILFTFVVAGVGMFALVKHLTGRADIAFFGGIAFAFCPYRTMHIVHTDLLSMGWIPLYTLFLLKSLREKSRLNPVVAGVFFTATVFTCNVYTYFLLVLTGFFVLYSLLLDRKEMLRRETLIRFLILALVCGVVLLPRFVSILQSRAAQTQPGWTLDILSANLVGYVLPTDKHVLYRYIYSLISGFKYYLSGVPGHATFLTYTVIGLAVLGVCKAPLKVTGFWVVVFLAFLVLSLGPSLHFWRWTTSLPLPYVLFNKWVPFFNVMRTPYRFVVLAEMGAIVLACYGLAYIAAKPRYQNGAEKRGEPASGAKLTRYSLIAGLSLLLLLELWNIPFYSSPETVPPAYVKIGEESGEFAVLDLPIDRYSDVTRYMYYQTLHEKPIPTGVISRADPSVYAFVEDLLPKESMPPLVDEAAVQRLKDNNVKYVIYHRDNDGADEIYLVYKLF